MLQPCKNVLGDNFTAAIADGNRLHIGSQDNCEDKSAPGAKLKANVAPACLALRFDLPAFPALHQHNIPALLAFSGRSIDRFQVPVIGRVDKPVDERLWVRWGRHISAHPWPWMLAGVLVPIAMVLALSFVVLSGFAGQTSLAQMAFAGVAGFEVDAEEWFVV